MKRIAIVFGLIAAFSLLSGCAATQLAISKHTLDVQSRMSESIFLSPSADKSIYVDVRNTTDKPGFDIATPLKASLEARGYRLVTDPEAAHLQLQVNVLQVGKADLSAAAAAFGAGFGTPIDGALSGVAAMAALGGHVTGGQFATAGLVGGAADFIAGNMVKDVTFSAITDIQVSERSRAPVHTNGEQDLQQGTSGSERVTYDEQSNWKRYRTRVMSTAEKANLKWEDAQTQLIAGLAQTISGVF